MNLRHKACAFFTKVKARKTAISVVLLVCLLLPACTGTSTTTSTVSSSQPGASSTQAPESTLPEDTTSTPAPTASGSTTDYTAIPLPAEMRAMWVAYPDFEAYSLTAEAEFRATYAQIAQNCKNLGLNTLIVIVRPFSDAMYPSSIYPWSYLLSGQQGVDPGYDPLQIMIEETHALGLRFEAYINPYRVKLNEQKPGTLSADNPAVTNPDWAVSVGESMWLDPGIPEVQAMVLAGVQEILLNYEVDGIHFDDYFYPTFTDAQIAEGLDTAFDEATYAAYGNGLSLAQWRRENVNTLVRAVYQTIKSINPSVSFGISPAGNLDTNYNKLYADIPTWMATEGYIDYILPQLYWEFGYTMSDGSTRFAFENIAAEWAALTRLDTVQLYAGLAAYKIHEGADDAWRSGNIMASQIAYLQAQPDYSGFALFRYGSLYEYGDADLRNAEISAIKEAIILG